MTKPQMQAALYYSRQRRGQRAGHTAAPHLRFTIRGSAALPVASLNTGLIFPNRETPCILETRIVITENEGVHRGLIFEFGSSSRGAAAWVGDETIGLTAGGTGDFAATALYDLNHSLPVGREYWLQFAIHPWRGTVDIYDRGHRLAGGVAVNGTFGAGGWSDSDTGSFAAAKQGTAPPGLPAPSDQAPAGFDVIQGLSVYYGRILA